MDEKILQENLKKIMKQQKLSMLKLAVLAGLNETAVRDILNGKIKNPTYKTLYHLAKVLKCKVDELFFKTEEASVGEEILLFNNAKINESVFAQAVLEVDNLILHKSLKINHLQKTNIYFSWYDLLLINQNVSPPQEKIDKLIDLALSCQSK